jgi:hypothetical protein
MHLKNKLVSVTFAQFEIDNWVVMGKYSEGTVNLGNFTTAAEAKALSDFFSAGIKSNLSFGQIQNLYESVMNLQGKKDI